MNTSKPTLVKIVLIFANVFLLSWNSFSQDQFRLSDYKNPEYLWHKLDLNLGLSGFNNFTKQEIDHGTKEKTEQFDLQ